MPVRAFSFQLSAFSFLLCAAALWSGCEGCGGELAPTADRSDGKLPTLSAKKLPAAAITVDGVPAEAAWKTTGTTGAFVHPGSGRPEPGSTVNAEAGIGWDDKDLFLWFKVRDANPTTPFSPDQVDPHVWSRASAVELMIQPGDPGDNKTYFEVQVDTGGAIWDTRFDDYNKPIVMEDGKRRYGHQRWKAGLRQAVKVVRGSHYTMELAIPWTSLSSDRAATPPRPGDTWRVNLYSFRDGQRAALAWSPIMGQGNFHKASRFGKVTFTQ